MTKFKSLICPIICYNLTINTPNVKPRSNSELPIPKAAKQSVTPAIVEVDNPESSQVGHSWVRIVELRSRSRSGPGQVQVRKLRN